MRPIAIALTLVVLTTACETTTDPFIGIGGGAGGPVTQAQATGVWSFTVTKTSALTCAVGALADGSRLTMRLDVQADGTVNAAASSWQNPPTTVLFPLSGSVTLSSGATDLFLSGGSGSLTGMELIGTITATGSFSGTLHDPGAGFTPMFSTAGCVYSAPGTKA